MYRRDPKRCGGWRSRRWGSARLRVMPDLIRNPPFSLLCGHQEEEGGPRIRSGVTVEVGCAGRALRFGPAWGRGKCGENSVRLYSGAAMFTESCRCGRSGCGGQTSPAAMEAGRLLQVADFSAAASWRSPTNL